MGKIVSKRKELNRNFLFINTITQVSMNCLSDGRSGNTKKARTWAIKQKSPPQKRKGFSFIFQFLYLVNCLQIWNKKGETLRTLPFPFQTIILTQTMFYYIRGYGSVRNLDIVQSWRSIQLFNMEHIAAFFNHY